MGDRPLEKGFMQFISAGASAAVAGDGQLRQRTRCWRWFGVAAVVVAAFVGWLSVRVGTPFQRMAVSDIVFVAAPLSASFSCWSARRRDSEWQAGWTWLAVGCLVWAGGSTIWAVYELLLKVPGPFPSFADIAYVGYALPVSVGLIKFPGAVGGLWSRLRVALDAAVIGLGLLFASAVWVLHPVFVAPGLGAFSRLDAMAYPLADVTIAAVTVTRCTMFSGARRFTWTTLGVGWLILAVTDSRYVALTTHNEFRPGHLLDTGWLLSFALVALAAQIPAPGMRPASSETGLEPAGMTQQLLPYGPVLLAIWAATRDSHRLTSHSLDLWLLVAVGVSVGIRQLAVVADHVALTRDLEQAVNRRTVEVVRQQQWWEELVRNLSDVVLVINPAGIVTYCSPSVELSLGYPSFGSWTIDDLYAQVHPDDLANVNDRLGPVTLGAQRSAFIECRIRRADESWTWLEVTVVGQLDDGVLKGVVLTLHDVTERQRLTEQLSHQAFYDSLTDLPNRALLMQRVQEMLNGAASSSCALIMIDLDDFKLINDSHGHSAGDLVLATIGKRIQHAVRSSDTVARLGGDEFAVLVSGTRASILATAGRISRKIEQPVAAGGRRFLVRASLGVVFASGGDTETAQLLMSHADIALYEAKARDKGGTVIIDGAERKTAADQVRLREQINQPNLDEFYVVYQPIVETQTGLVRGVESLLRWNHPELGEISPTQFIPLAEHGGSIGLLGWHVLEVACQQLATWSAMAPQRRLAVGVNVSILQLDEADFAARVVKLIAHHGLRADQLVIEMTEQSLSRDFETAVTVVSELRAAGVSVAVDDYGTGYSSLRYLHRFDADVVKIDRSFIANLQDSEHTQKIVRSVIQMAESLDLQCIAEGIETQAQLDIVTKLGCELAQGYLFSRPVSAETFTDILSDDTHPWWQPDAIGAMSRRR
jgi:diguanylate cyclase (GGDEF)-like protein/PAS domain S-box-containing protein